MALYNSAYFQSTPRREGQSTRRDDVLKFQKAFFDVSVHAI
ncbi:Uncharacterized protein dnm_098870 [Desulfonema magnum]|uniref:Uncharacterized protein n=1 Tax=Desulfonema magnum TaxID=45655 RepID=A0A975GU44_9BACT|nr:Uncharacterized protein dnm_098870 [Desulfonema magnum]